MFREASEAPAVVARQLEANREAVAALGERLRAMPPRALVTCARGSSDHSATFAKYLVETRLGVLTASAAPSVASIYGARQRLDGCLFLVISQSGRSPDLVAAMRAARECGACVVALVNDDTSPVAREAEHTIALHAGKEVAVAATKSFIASLAAIVHVVCEWASDQRLRAALDQASADLESAWALDWSAAVACLCDAHHLYVVGRGVGLAVAQEAALKLKETCALHAEAFSSAEVRHGPQALLGPQFPALLFVQDDEARAGLERLGADLVQRGVPVLHAGGTIAGATALPAIAADAAIAPMLFALSFYRMVDALAAARGIDPDDPPHLAKVTRTT